MHPLLLFKEDLIPSKPSIFEFLHSCINLLMDFLFCFCSHILDRSRWTLVPFNIIPFIVSDHLSPFSFWFKISIMLMCQTFKKSIILPALRFLFFFWQEIWSIDIFSICLFSARMFLLLNWLLQMRKRFEKLRVFSQLSLNEGVAWQLLLNVRIDVSGIIYIIWWAWK